MAYQAPAGRGQHLVCIGLRHSRKGSATLLASNIAFVRPGGRRSELGMTVQVGAERLLGSVHMSVGQTRLLSGPSVDRSDGKPYPAQ